MVTRKVMENLCIAWRWVNTVELQTDTVSRDVITLDGIINDNKHTIPFYRLMLEYE